MQIIPVVSITYLLLKIFFIVALSIYLIFALVVMRQTQIMSNTVKLGFELPVKLLAILHFLFALGTLVFAFLVL